MQIQYIADNHGHTTAVQLQRPIEDWDLFKKKHREFEQEEINLDIIPDWQIALGKEELLIIANKSAELEDWEIAKKQFKF